MDVTRFGHRYLTAAEVEAEPYVGQIVGVEERELRNRFRATVETQLVVTFADGRQWVPNVTAVRTLINSYGTESDNWRGQRVRIEVETVRTTAGKSRKQRVVVPLPHLIEEVVAQ